MKVFALRRNIASLVFVLTVSLLCAIWVISSVAQTSSQEDKTPGRWKVKKTFVRRLGVKPKDTLGTDERVIEDQIPPHLPIKIEFENLDIEPLLSNLEIKVTNTSDKPIYYLRLGIILPDVLSSTGDQIAFSLRYGRIMDFEETARPEDVSILPGESYVFKTPEHYPSHLKSRHSEIRRVFLFFQMINFGDKTGFWRTDGTPVPNTRKTSGACLDGNRGDPEISLTAVQASYSSGALLQHSFGLPSFIKTSGSISRHPPQSNLCCPGSSCSFSKPSKYNCHCGVADTTVVTGCNDPEGSCADIFQNNDRTCPDGAGGQVTCPEFFVQSCSGYCDKDGDRWYSTSCGGKDCNDNDPNITPFSPQCKPTPIASNGCDPDAQRNCLNNRGKWNSADCSCNCPLCPSPVVIDTEGDGFALTDFPGGVSFDLNGDGSAEQISWTDAGSDDAFLALDRNYFSCCKSKD